MYSIGEFSKITSLPIKTLRFYHEKDLLVPVTVDPDTGYRYYNHSNVEKARVIVALRALDFSLDEIGVILIGCQDDTDLLDHLKRRKAVVTKEIRRQQDIVSMLDSIIQSEKEARSVMRDATFSVEEKTLESMLVAGVRMKGKYSDCGKAFSTLGKAVGRYINGKPFCLYYDGEYRDDDADMEPCFPIRKEVQVDAISVRMLSGGRCVSLIHKGPYDQLGRSYEKVLAYTRDRNYEIVLPTREVYITGPGMIFKGNPKRYLTEIQLVIQS